MERLLSRVDIANEKYWPTFFDRWEFKSIEVRLLNVMKFKLNLNCNFLSFYL